MRKIIQSLRNMLNGFQLEDPFQQGFEAGVLTGVAMMLLTGAIVLYLKV